MSIERELVGVKHPLGVNFAVGLEPIRTTHQTDLRILRTKDGRQFIGKTSKSKVKKWGEAFALMVRRHKPDRPLEGPLWLQLVFGFPLNKADKGVGTAHAARPDWDNLPKTVCDILTREGFWHDDGQVVIGTVMKVRTATPFIGVRVNETKLIDEEFIKLTYDSFTD
jgi:Holliday junction resolvase RusA-like endonuclease